MVFGHLKKQKFENFLKLDEQLKLEIWPWQQTEINFISTKMTNKLK